MSGHFTQAVIFQLLINSYVVPLFLLKNECHGSWGDRYETTIKVIKKCWKQGQVLHDPSFGCYALNTRGPCEEGSRIVYKNEDCPHTWCRPYKDKTGSPCSSSTVEFNGYCVDPEDASICDHQPGKRLVPDLWGNYSCQCSSNLGFLAFEGKCYPKYLQGPCIEGEQVVRGQNGSGLCRKDSCVNSKIVNSVVDTNDFYQGPSDVCYNILDLFYQKLENSSTSLSLDEKMLFKEDPRFNSSNIYDPTVLTFGSCLETHCTCQMVSRTTGDCLETVTLDPDRFNQEFDWNNVEELLVTFDEIENITVVDT